MRDTLGARADRTAPTCNAITPIGVREDKHIVAVAIELLGKVTDELTTDRVPRRA